MIIKFSQTQCVLDLIGILSFTQILMATTCLAVLPSYVKFAVLHTQPIIFCHLANLLVSVNFIRIRILNKVR